MESGSPMPLTIYKVKAGFTPATSFDIAAFATQSFNLSGASNCLLASRQSEPSPPSWLPYVQSITGKAIPELSNAQAGALLYLEVAKEPFVICFGSAHMKVNDEAVERGFGLKVTLNCVEPDKMSTVDSQNLDLNGIHRRIQASSITSLEEFDLDVEGSLVRAVTGCPSDASIGAKITGRDGLKLLTRCSASDVPALLKRLSEYYKSDRYKEKFDWIDNLDHVRDPGVRHALDAHLVKGLNTKPAQTWLALPEIVDWVEIDGFTYGARSKEVELDLSLEKFIQRQKNNPIYVDSLHNAKVKVIGANGNVIKKWSIYKCLYTEATIDGDSYILSSGEWYRVKPAYYEELANFMKSMKCSVGTLPDCQAGMKEDEYNVHVYKTGAGKYLLGDRKVWSCGSKAGKLELCDLYCDDNRIIHVKKYGQSKVLGHLFNQALVSAEVLVMDKQARKAANKLLGTKTDVFPEKFESSKYTVVMAIVSEQPGEELSLPLFSRIALRNAIQRIRVLGYKSQLAKIRQPHFAKAK